MKIVSLWNWGSRNLRPSIAEKSIAVKMVTNPGPAYDLRPESDILAFIGKASEHIVRLHTTPVGSYMNLLNDPWAENNIRLAAMFLTCLNSQYTDMRIVLNQASRALESLTAAWEGRVRRLVMEYCPNGDLSDLQKRRRVRYALRQNTHSGLLTDSCLDDSLCMN